MATLRENCRIKISSKNRNCGDAKIFLNFVVKNIGQTQKPSGPKVADRQHVGVETVRDDWCRIETVRVEIGQILKTDL